MKNHITNFKKNELIKFYSTGSSGTGLSVVKSHSKLNILSILDERELEFDKIVNKLGKSKSTISTHLNDLRKEGIISFKFKQNDQRKKIFFISAKFLGEIEAIKSIEFEEEKIQEIIEGIITNESENVELTRLFFHTLRYTMMQEGLNTAPLFYETGQKTGKHIYNLVKTDDFNDFTENIRDFWKNHDLGKVKIDLISDNNIAISIKDCFECRFLPKSGKSTCFLDLGLFESLFSEYFGKKILLTQTKSYANSDDHCYFELLTDSRNSDERVFAY